MIKISRQEVKHMREVGYSELIHHTYTKHKTYYMVEETKAIRELERYRESITTKIG